MRTCSKCGQTKEFEDFHRRGVGYRTDCKLCAVVQRGVLCVRCNSAIGQMRDEPWLLRAAADYLERHGKVHAA